MDLFSHAQTHNVPEFSVSEISGALKNMVEDHFGFVRIRGEISGAKRAPSGHFYLTLKDQNANLSAVCWRGNAARLEKYLQDGLDVVCSGKMTTFPGQSKYQLVIDKIELAGVGALMQLLEKTKEKLTAEGLFSAERKQDIPYFPARIGIITSPTGAVIKDILHRLEDRFPCHAMLWPVLVQGEKAKAEIVAAIEGFQKIATPPEVIIIARGGGSIEDLWSFNEEAVVRAVAACTIPVISAIGHETDTTLIDYVADLRAPTPTAAAELATPVKEDLVYHLGQIHTRLEQVMRRQIERLSNEVSHLGKALPRPQILIEQKGKQLESSAVRLERAVLQRVAEGDQMLLLLASRLQNTSPMMSKQQAKIQQLGQSLSHALERLLERQKQKLMMQSKLLESCDYQRILARGFAVVSSGETIITKAENATEVMTIQWHDGSKNVETK